MTDINPFWGSAGYGSAYKLDIDRVKRAQRRAVRRRAAANRELEEEIEELRGELEFVTLALGAVLAHLDHEGVATREALREIMIAADAHDGTFDGRMPVAVLQELLRPPTLDGDG